ncbi:MAG: PHP domain-containing protein [Burkholderiaceae bacterium]|nr:PHP domain-containing protein [Burkholderiaceae bacterium]
MAVDSRLCADLHCHSTVSDGVLTPQVLARRAFTQGVTLWSLTDHDEISGQTEAREAARMLGMTYLTGVEISVTWAARTVHIVGLGFDPDDRVLETGLRETRSGREARARRIGDNFARLGIPGVFEGALQYAGNPDLVSRTHFARFLVQAGHCPDVQSVFDRYLSDDGIANEPMQWTSLENAVRWIHDAGGRAVIAHPGRYHYNATQFSALFDAFKDLGGEAIEVVTGSHTPAQFIEYAAIARGYGFMASCGSDFHSPSESRHDLGSLPSLPADLTPVWDSLV